MVVGRRCNRCGEMYPPHLVEAAFRSVRTRDASCVRRPGNICRACADTARDQRKVANRWAVKARDVVRRHAIRLEISKEDLVERYGWNPGLLAHDAEFQYGNGCNYCAHPYIEMGHGLADITLDIQDRSKPPGYRTNTKWCCQTCNRKKGAMTPEAWEAHLEMWRRWASHQQMLKNDPQSCGLLF